MAIANTPTLLPLDRYAAVMGIDPLVFNGAVAGCLGGQPGGCSDVWLMGNGRYAGIDYLAEHIAHAEAVLADYLCTPMAPTWITDEASGGFARHASFRPQQPRTALVFSTRYKHVAGFVVRNASKLGDGAVAYSDVDGDGYSEVATVTLALAEEPDLTTVRLYLPGEADPADEIRPFDRVIYDGGNLTFTLPTYFLLKPAVRQAAQTAVDVCEADNLLTTVEVWQETAVAQDATLTYDSSQCQACATTTATTCLQLVDGRRGRARAPLAGCYIGLPQTAVYSYRAGLPLTRDGRLQFERAIALLATARMGQDICNCGVNIRTLDYYRRDMSARDDGFFKLHDNAPMFFGTKVGEVMAAREILNRKKVWA